MTEAPFDPAYPIFHAVAYERQMRAFAASTRFAYYTTAETAVQVLKNSEIWLRMPTCMNDASEVQHGHNAVLDHWESEEGAKLAGVLDEIYPGISDDLAARLDQDSIPELLAQTYIACLSEHGTTAEEDRLGRLSMWRAYGGKSGVAIIMKGDPLFAEGDGLNVYSSPVEYLDAAGIENLFLEFRDRMSANKDFLLSIGRENTLWWLYQAMTMAMLCVKHPAFVEEREWRIFHSEREPSSILRRDVETIRGVAQPVIKLPLKDNPDGSKSGRALADILERIIVGPTDFPLATASAFVDLLTKLGVPDAGKKVIISGIPLRSSS